MDRKVKIFAGFPGLLGLGGLVLILAAMTAPALGAEFYLIAKPYTKTLPDGAVVTMWGFAEDVAPLGTDEGETASSPGPRLTVPVGDTSLTIHVLNTLPESISIVIPGQSTPLTPESFVDLQGRERVSSFTYVTDPTLSGTYTWSDVKPGSFVYQSGTHPAKQVPMGLYGAMTKDAAAGVAYDENGRTLAYDSEVVLFYSEIDPVLNGAVVGGTYGTPAYPTTIDYAPTYFLVNGSPFEVGQAPIAAGTVGQAVLVRLFSACSESHVPLFQGAYVTVEAESGNLRPFEEVERYSVLLSPLSTVDVLWTPGKAMTIPVYDRRLQLTTNGLPYGGMLSYLQVTN